MQEGMTIGQHVAQIEEMAYQLDDIGEKQSEAAIVTKTLHSLPASYMHVISAWDSLPEEKQTMSNLLPRLLKAESLTASMNELTIGDDTRAALYPKDSKTPESKSKKKTYKFGGKCYHCKKLGHRKNDCIIYKREQKKESSKETGSTIAIDGSILMAKVGYNKDINEIWFADTGASHHMSPKREFFRDFEEIHDGTFPITVGNNQIVYAKGRGKIIAEFDVDGQQQKRTLVDVLYVPDLGRNLFGIGSTTDRGAIAIFGKSDMTLKINGNVVAQGWRPRTGLYRVKMKALINGEAILLARL